MAQEKYFREELTFLKEQGKQFTEIHPQLSRFLHGQVTDPDVERLLEGFAFLTARLREKVEDEFPELTHSVINMLWPNYLRPVPSMSILAFTPEEKISEKQWIKCGVQVDSNKVFDTACHFQTCRDVAVYPMQINRVTSEHSREASQIDIELKLFSEISAGGAQLDSLRFYLGGDRHSAQMLYLWLNHSLADISLHIGEAKFSLGKHCLKQVGFNSDDALLPYPKNVYQGYRILQEYLAYPEAFHFFDIVGLDRALPADARGQFTLRLSFTKTLPSDVRISEEHFQLYCTPIVNLFEHDADPIALTGKKSEYRIIPSGKAPAHYEVFSVDGVYGWQDKTQDSSRVRGEKRVYYPFESFTHQVERARQREVLYYRTRVRESMRNDGFESFISFVRGDESVATDIDEAISVKLTCTNRLLPVELGIGDICHASSTTPTFVTFRNITEPSQSLRPVLDGSLLWKLISNLSLNYVSLLSKEALNSVLRAYDFRALVDRQAERVGRKRLEGISEIKSKPIDKLLRGLPIRGLQTEMHLDQSCFGSEGDLYLFGTVLSHFFALYANINSFHQLVVVNKSNNEIYTWGMQTGTQPLI